MQDELKPEDVMRAIECCLQTDGAPDCYILGCPARLGNGLCFYETDCEFNSEEECLKKMLADALALLRGKDDLLAEWDAKLKSYETELMGKDAEIERLQSAWLKAQMDAEQKRFQCKNICEPTYKNLLETARAENAELIEDIQQCMYYAKPKNNNTCNFCKRDGGEGGHPCKGREDWVDCSPIWRGVVREKMEGEG